MRSVIVWPKQHTTHRFHSQTARVPTPNTESLAKPLPEQTSITNDRQEGLATAVNELLLTENSLWTKKKGMGEVVETVWTLALCFLFIFVAMALVVLLLFSVSSLPNWLSFHSMWQSFECVLVCPWNFPTHRYLFLNTEHVYHSRVDIGTAPTFFQADLITLKTTHTTGQSNKRIFRTIRKIGTFVRVVRRGESSPKSAWLPCIV